MLLTLLVIWVTGVLFLRMLRAPKAWGVSRLPEVIGTGSVLLHIDFLVLGRWGRVLDWEFLILPLTFGALLAVPAVRRHLSPLGKKPSVLFPVGLLLLLLLQFVLVYPSLHLPLFDWDARILWGLKAKFLVADGTAAGPAFSDPYRLHIHPRYPLLVPWLTAEMALASGGFEEIQLRATVICFAVLTVWQLHQFLTHRTDRWTALTLSLILVLTGGWVAAQSAPQVECVLAFYLLLALIRVLYWLERRFPRDIILAALFLAGAVLTKNEGGLLLLCTLVALALAPPLCARRLQAAGFMLSISVLLVCPCEMVRKCETAWRVS